jgi:hypothetical protein
MYFHAAMVHHQDLPECSYPDKNAAHIDTDGFKCDIDQQVISFPFVVSIQSLNVEEPSAVYVLFSEAPVPVLLSASLLTGSRGPPNT